MRLIKKHKWVGSIFYLVLLGFFLTGCATTSQLEDLEQRVQAVEETSNMAMEKAEGAEADESMVEQYSIDASQSADRAENAAEDAERAATKAERMADKCAQIFDKLTAK
ncbi:MAG: Lpp/OprI family alanine-zipper lipoprotein [Desulfovermiculus sp.]